ncbi:MAG TPA: hypothetical protein VHE99_09370 [Gammaproteobacteria bacterium]|nr:hypothetical protein [Gammaproteobacteria bacterium]
MTRKVYTNARPRKIPFFTFDQFLYISVRPVFGSAANIPAILFKPSVHNALWKQNRRHEMSKNGSTVTRNGVG